MSDEDDGGTATSLQRFGFGSAANLDADPHDLVPDGVYWPVADGAPTFAAVDVPTDDALRALLQMVIARLMKTLRRQGMLVED